MASSRSQRSLRASSRVTKTQHIFSYAEETSPEPDEEDDLEELRTDSKASHIAPRRRVSSRTQKTSVSSTKRHRPAEVDWEDDKRRRRPKRRKQPSTSKKSTAPEVSSYNVQTNGVIPAWQSLPYHVLLQIFRYATYPLYDEQTFQPQASSAWLLKVALVCRSFAEPAFTVLLMTPPLVPMDKAHNLVELLKANPRAMAFKYRHKVESLCIEVRQVAAYSLAGRGPLNLYDLIKDLPRLVDLEFYHQKDMPPYRNLDDSIKFHYPENLFDALEIVDPNAEAAEGDKTSVCKLRSWRWSSRLAEKVYPIHNVREVHLRPSFEALRKIAFVNYQVPYVKATEEDPKHEAILAKSLEPLKNLEHLIFDSSTLVNSVLLPLLPRNLRNLELINCWNLKAEELADFLLSHGKALRCLTMNHNQSLNLSFLPVLGLACPELQVLRMNLTFYQLHSSYRDSDPLYEQLLLPDQVPVWPSKLQMIELTQLRKWDTVPAEMFFQSLLDSAAHLPDLRRLTIQAILNIGWRDRASFRDKWLGSLDRVFKRVSPPPVQHESLRPQIAIQEDLKDDDHLQEIPVKQRNSLRSGSVSSSSSLTTLASDTEEERAEEASPPSRRSTRTSARQIQTGTYAESPDSSDERTKPDGPSARQLARSARALRELAILKQTAGRDLLPESPPQTTEEDNAADDDEPLVKQYKGRGKATEVIQGMCETVNIRIDNLRPTETQVTEADFLDEEAPGDGDWNEADGDSD